MALLNQAKIFSKPSGFNKLGCLLVGRPKATSGLIRSFATTLRRQGHPADGGAWAYRNRNPPPTALVDNLATAAMTFVYWWIFWHLFTEPGHVFGGSRFGEFDHPDPLSWTDEELGIPPDDYEE